MLPASPDKTCVLPDWWCNDEGEVLAKSDCGDGDGVDDWACVNPATGQRKVLLSSSDCGDDHWPDAPRSWCPPLFNSKCTTHATM